MGHFAFGGGNPVEALEKYFNRIWHIHFKDFDPKVGRDAVENNYDYFKSVEKGVFCELGKGDVDFQSIVNILNEKGFDGWSVSLCDKEEIRRGRRNSNLSRRRFWQDMTLDNLIKNI